MHVEVGTKVQYTVVTDKYPRSGLTILPPSVVKLVTYVIISTSYDLYGNINGIIYLFSSSLPT